MIVMTLINVILGILSFVMGLLPNIPQMPNVVKDGVDLIFGYIVSVTGFAAYLFTPALLGFIITASILMLTWNTIYNGFMWVIRKLPFLGVQQ